MSSDSDLARRVRDATSVDHTAFRERAGADAEVVKDRLRGGAFDNHQSIVGFEYEFYAVADGRWSEESRAGEYALMRVPRRLLGLMGFEKELGLHNAEMSTSPQPLSEHGLNAQESEVRARLDAALDCASAEGMRLVSDGMWTIPPAGESADEYLTDSVEIGGVRIATNMSAADRYHAMANDGSEGSGTDSDASSPRRPAHLEAPGVSLPADTVMPESLITSIQPHYQVAQASTLPIHFRYALRIAGPLLALSANSPLFPPELDDDAWVAEPHRVVSEGARENRIHVFESVMNGWTDDDKVRFPRDLETVEAAVDRIAADETIVPMPVDRGDRFDDDFATFRTKHGTYWRWIRPVFEGATRSAANARIEFRPIAAQPTARDSIAFQAAFAGLMEGLPQREHPVHELEWEHAEANFYAAVADGIDADLRWIDADGTELRDGATIYTDLLDEAEAGLRDAGCTPEEAMRWIAPIRWRAEEWTTPASWKLDRFEKLLDDGATFEAAIHGAQRAYIGKQTDSLLEGSFADW